MNTIKYLLSLRLRGGSVNFISGKGSSEEDVANGSESFLAFLLPLGLDAYLDGIYSLGLFLWISLWSCSTVLVGYVGFI